MNRDLWLFVCVMVEVVLGCLIVYWNGVVEKSIFVFIDKVWDVVFDFFRFLNLFIIEFVEGEN